MIAAVLILSAGVLLAVLSVLLRKKMSRSWGISLLAAGVLIAACGGLFTHEQWTQIQQRRESVYLSLRYLEQYQVDSCFYYLKRAGAVDNYESAAARYLLEKARKNELSARLNLDIARSTAKTQEETAFLDALQNLDVYSGDQLMIAINRITGFLGLSDKQRSRLDSYFQAESGGFGYGYGVPGETDLDENLAGRLKISALLQNGAYEQAVFAAAQLADQHPNADNRLLLAEAVAESTYSNVILTSADFAPADSSEPWEDPSIQKERQELLDQRIALEDSLLEFDIASIGSSQDENSQKRLELTEQIQALQNRADKLYTYRAFNAIADLHSMEADLVRARLYFALQEYNQAVDTLRGAADSLNAVLSTDQNLKSSLRIVDEAYEENNVFRESQEFQDALVYLLSAPFSDLMYMNQTPLTQDFAQHIISDLKVYGQSLFVTQLDTTQFPQMKVTVAGREELLEKIVTQTDTQVRDTRQSVQYTAWMQEQALSNVCVVVDRSGSMGGAPIQNLKSALESFIRNMTADTMVSLVAFDSSAQELAELTQDQATLLTQVNTLSGNGGTEITAGIKTGLESLSNSVGARVMLLMTDGQSSVDFSVVEEAAAAGITIHTIGFGDVNDALLEQIAERTGGQYIKADSSSELSNVYASLQRVIGHVITLEYTVSNPETTQQRYFFLNVDGYSIYINYLRENGKKPASLYVCTPSVLTPDEVERNRQQGREFTLRLTGEQLLDVASVAVNGRAAQITEQADDQLTVQIGPGFQSGWQPVTLTLKDGTQQSFDRLLLVGETEYFPSLRLGSLTIQRSQGVLPGDGTLVLAGSQIRLYENVSEGESSLFLYVTGTLVLPVSADLQEALENTSSYDEVDLGTQGSIFGWGVVYLNSNDRAYNSNAPDIAAKGGLTFTCGPTQSELIQGEEGGR